MEAYSAEFYKGIIDFIGDPVFVKDRKRRLVHMNEANSRALGRPRAQLIGLTDDELFPKREADVFRERDEKVFLTGEEDINEETLTAPNLETRILLTRKKRYVDASGAQFIVGVFKDITAIRSAEEKLQKANETLEQKVRERTEELELANAEMKLRIEQLHYLNEKGRLFSQLLEREDVLAEVFNTFVERFPGCPLQLVERAGGRFRGVHQTETMIDHSARCLESLEDPQILQRKKIVFEKPGPGVPAVWPLFPGRIWIPFWSGGELLGGAQVFLPERFSSKFMGEAPVLGTLSNQASIALDNSNHYRALGENARIESELQVAKKIQMHYTPGDPSIPNISLHGVCLSAREIGGDYLDYFQNENGDWVIAIADVCGKGIPAALVTTSLRSCIRIEGRKTGSSKALLLAVNRLMGAELQREKSFITCLCMVISRQGSLLNMSRAGHPALVAYGRAGAAPKPLTTRGMVLGVETDEVFGSLLEEVTFPLAPGDKFFAYTDGVNEAMDIRSRTYGKTRLLGMLEAGRELAPAELIRKLLTDIESHVQGQRQHDDMTLLALARL